MLVAFLASFSTFSSNEVTICKICITIFLKDLQKFKSLVGCKKREDLAVGMSLNIICIYCKDLSPFELYSF